MPPTEKLTTPCPACGATLTGEASVCICGQTVATPKETWTSAHLVAQAESLFQRYLAVRLDRARKVLKLAQFDLAQRPMNADRVHQVHEAKLEVARLETQLDEQTHRTYSARHTAGERSRQAVSDAAASTEADSDAPEAVASNKPTLAFTAKAARRADRIVASGPRTAGGPAPFITHEEFNILRNVARAALRTK